MFQLMNLNYWKDKIALQILNYLHSFKVLEEYRQLIFSPSIPTYSCETSVTKIKAGVGGGGGGGMEGE